MTERKNSECTVGEEVQNVLLLWVGTEFSHYSIQHMCLEDRYIQIHKYLCENAISWKCGMQVILNVYETY